MIVVPKNKALVFKLRDPGRVTNIIPSAKVLELNGQPIVAVPHRMDETRVLRNLGFQVPSPIKFYHPWPARWPAFEAQRETSEFLTLCRNAFILNELGTGKTLAALWAYDYLRSIGELHRALVVAPLSTLERVWGDEVFMHFPHLTVHMLYGTRDRRMKLLDEPGDLSYGDRDPVDGARPEWNINGDWTDNNDRWYPSLEAAVDAESDISSRST